MLNLFNWFHRNPGLHWSIIGVFLILYISLHDIAQQPFFWYVAEFDYNALQLLLNLLFGLLLLVIGFWFFRRLIHLQNRSLVLIVVTFLLILSLIGYVYIMPYKSEGVHFLQYGLLALICYPLTYSLFYPLSLSIFLGMLDEHWQYLISQKLYLDFNDMFLNSLASGLGVLFAYIIAPKHGISQRKTPNLKHPYMLILLWGIGLGILLISGIVVHFDDPISQGKWFLYRHDIKTYDPAFWYEVPWGSWHQFRPITGIILIVLFPLIFLYFDRVIRKTSE